MVSRGATFIAPLPGTPPVGMSATDGRLSLGGIFGVTPQLVAGGGVAQSGSVMQFTVAQSVFQLVDVTNAAATAFLPTDSIVLTIAAGPGTGSRIDLICVPLNNYENGGGASQSVPVVIAGTAGAPGIAPAVPTNMYKYAQILVPTSAANAAACTVTIYGNTTFAPMPLLATTLAKLNLTTGVTGQSATVTADTVNNGRYVWNGTVWASTFAFVDVRMTAAQTSAASVFTPVVWDTDASNVFAWHSTVTNPSRITVPYAGRYRITAQLEGSSTAAGQYMAIGLRVNGTPQVFTQNVAAASAGNYPSASVKTDLILTAGSYVEVDGFQGSAYAMHVTFSYFQLSYISAS